MAPKNPPSTPGHLNSFGGEMLTRVPEGAVTGALIGLIIGVAFFVTISTGTVVIPGAELVMNNRTLLFIAVLIAGIVGAFAGALVGIGIPKHNPTPEQGLVKRWKTIFRRSSDSDEEVIFVPDQKRKHLRNNEEQVDEHAPRPPQRNESVRRPFEDKPFEEF